MKSTEKDILIEKIKTLSLEQIKKVLVYIEVLETGQNSIKENRK